MAAKAQTFEAIITLSVHAIPAPFAISVAVPAGPDQRKRAEICAKVTAAAMLGMEGGNG